jgi:hypothetical protein
MIYKISIIVLLFSFINNQGYAQDLYNPRIDSLKSITNPKFIESLYQQPQDYHSYFNRIMRQKLESNFNTNTNFDYLQEYIYKSYNMSEYYNLHRLNTTPGFIRDQNPLPPHVNFQRIDIIKKKNK